MSNQYSTSVPFGKAKRMCRELGVVLTKEDRQYVVKELRRPSNIHRTATVEEALDVAFLMISAERYITRLHLLLDTGRLDRFGCDATDALG